MPATVAIAEVVIVAAAGAGAGVGAGAGAGAEVDPRTVTLHRQKLLERTTMCPSERRR